MDKPRTYLITGATGGFGSRVCRLLVSEGSDVIAVSRSSVRLEALRRELGGQTGGVRVLQGDFSLEESTRTLCQGILDCGVALSGLVLIYPRVPKSDGPLPDPKTWLDAFEQCFVLPMEVLKTAIELMDRGSRIVVVSGISNTQVFPQLPMSNVIRSSWLAQAKTLAHVYGTLGIHVNTVSFGGTLTEKFKENLRQRSQTPVGSIYEDCPENIPLGRYGDPDDAARVIRMMLSELSNHMTGANVICDGGLVRRY